MANRIFIEGSIMLLLLICGGCGGKRQVDSVEQLTATDTIAMLRKLGSFYVGAIRPDSVTFTAMVKLQNIRERGIPESIDVIGPNSILHEGRIELLNIAISDEIFSGRRCFLELTWPIDKYVVDGVTDSISHDIPCHITIWYEIHHGTVLIPVDTLYFHDCM